MRPDVLKMLADACKEEGLPLGFYYSPPDMNHPGYRDTSRSPHENFRGEPWRPEWPLFLSYMELQLRELLTRYGDVEVLWFDGLGGKGYDPVRMEKVIHELQPQTAINNRLGIPGDFDTPEQKVPSKMPERLWETCMTINGTWAYNQNDLRFKSTETLIHTLVEIVSKGGNFLLNVGPTPDGEIQPEFAERLCDIGQWLKLNGEAIYGTDAGPLQKVPWGRTTRHGKNIYLHVFDWPKGPLTVQGLRERVGRVVLLAGAQPLGFQQSGDELTIRVPAQAPDTRASVMRIETQ
jgi:alpha-L-fucosidase